jgi:hypothetical protein
MKVVDTTSKDKKHRAESSQTRGSKLVSQYGEVRMPALAGAVEHQGTRCNERKASKRKIGQRETLKEGMRIRRS